MFKFIIRFLNNQRGTLTDVGTIAVVLRAVALSIASFMFTMMLSACAPQSITANLGQPFALKMDQLATLNDGLVVTFVDVPTDGRCSSCTASSSAQVVLRMTPPGKSPILLNLFTPPTPPARDDSLPYSVTLVDLQPLRRYPPDSINRAEYVVNLMIVNISQPIALGDLPIYPNAIELRPGEAHLVDSITKFVLNDDALLKGVLDTAPSGQRMFSVPKDTRPDALSKFYDDKLSPTGWKSEPSKTAMLENVRQPTDISMFQVSVWTRGKQTLVMVYAVSPGYNELIYALAPN